MHRTLNLEVAEALRTAKGISCRQLARDIHRDHGHVSRVLRGKHKASPATIAAIAAQLGVSYDAITTVSTEEAA